MSQSHILVDQQVVPGCLTLRCEHCGVRLSIKLPVSVDEMAGASEGFIARHRHCSHVATPAAGEAPCAR